MHTSTHHIHTQAVFCCFSLTWKDKNIQTENNFKHQQSLLFPIVWHIECKIQYYERWDYVIIKQMKCIGRTCRSVYTTQILPSQEGPLGSSFVVHLNYWMEIVPCPFDRLEVLFQNHSEFQEASVSWILFLSVWWRRPRQDTFKFQCFSIFFFFSPSTGLPVHSSLE